MSPVNFDSVVLNTAMRHGLMLYIIFALAFLLLSFYAGYHMASRRRILFDFPTLLLVQLANLCLFLAFAAVAGQFPREFWLATLAIGFTGWMIQWLLMWTAGLSDIGKASAEATIAQAIVTSELSFWAVVVAIFTFAQSVFQLGLLIYVGFLFDPMQMGNSAYLAKVAAYSLVIPVALQLVPTLLVQIKLLISEYTTPAVRNLCLAAAVSNVALSLTLVVGPLYVYRDGFPSIASVIPPLGSLVAILIGIFTLLLIIPYFFGYLSNLRLSASLKESVKDFISRAEVLSKRHVGDYREQEEKKLLDNIINAYTALTKNSLLYFFALKLLEKFAQEAHTDDCQKRRLTMLQSLGFGNTAPYEGNPVENIRQIRTAIKIKPFYRFNVPVKSYFSLVENHLDIVAKAHPLLLNFGKLTKILGAIVDEDPEREDIFADLRPSEQPGGKIRPSLPGWVLTAISSILGGFGKGLFDQLWPLLGPLVGAR